MYLMGVLTDFDAPSGGSQVHPADSLVIEQSLVVPISLANCLFQTLVAKPRSLTHQISKLSDQ